MKSLIVDFSQISSTFAKLLAFDGALGTSLYLHLISRLS